MNTELAAAGRQIRNNSGLQWLTRVGIACKGVVYVLIGALALLAAFHQGGDTTDQKGVIRHIAVQPFGEFALIVIGVGLLAYAAWRFTSSALDSEHEGSKLKGIAARVGQVTSGIVYAGIAYTALKAAAGSPAGRSNAAQTWTARLLDSPGGPLLVVLAGLVVLGVAAAQVHHGLKESFKKHLRMSEMSRDEVRWATRAGKWGYVSRGVVFTITGLFLITAALHSNPGEARGIEGALDTLAVQPFGRILMALVAAGLLCYGAYTLFESRYRSVRF